MKDVVVFLFVVSLLGVSFLALNYLWNWVDVDYSSVVRIILSLLIATLTGTGLFLVFKGGYTKTSNHTNIGKK